MEKSSVTKHLLLLVDDWEALEVYENILGAHFKLYSSPFGKEGIQLAQELSSQGALDRILIDLTFEDMHAREACELLRKGSQTRSIPLTVILNKGEEVFKIPKKFPLPRDHIHCRPYPFEELLSDLKK